MPPLDLSAARSRIPFSPHRAAERLDPFWDYVWSRGSVAQWRSRRKEQSRRYAGVGRAASWFHTDAEFVEAAGANLHRARREVKLGVMGALDSWRTMTAQQASAFLGESCLLTSSAQLVRELYALDLVDVGSDAGFSDKRVTGDDVREWLIRPTRSTQFQKLIAPTLTFPESVHLTGGDAYLTGGQYDRHNVLATELGLRLAEFTRAAAVLGEKWCGATELLFEGWGRTTPYPSLQNRADLAVVRPDGLRVAIEMTASAGGKSFDRKVAKWAQQLAVQPLSEQGTVVLFVVCGEQHPKTGDTDALRRQVQAAIVRAVRSFPGNPGNLVAERMLVASWTDWFPGRHQLIDNFDKLPAWYPAKMVGAQGMEQVWAQTELFNQAAFPYAPAAGLDPLAVAANARTLAATPHWMREDDIPQIAFDAVKEMWPAGPPGVTREQLVGRGARAAITLPERCEL
ncbi:hypothetical protein [Leucobacter sp. cx-169]|uniref:hypothetical protein n=1 Tax=Leucobacter sp. cx-169 TaxID=2770549 RepID=UPI00165DDDEA|nr:hypothetical protein [Leucobacter sp. cx-169]MBC9927391.1 hypothetical protein [Leucobacter sp. cx-169]